jgi:hypothetical protein
LQEQEGQLQEREGQLQEREELDDITLRRELEVLSTCKTSLEHREAELEWDRKSLEDARAQILARELDANSRETGLRDHEPDWWPGSSICRSWPSSRRGWRTSRPPELEMNNASRASWARQMLL